ncbi:MAG: hypothetical protein ACRC2S_02315 [Waterburya sp.]
MSKLNNQSIDLFAIPGVQDLSNENAAAVAGGAVSSVSLGAEIGGELEFFDVPSGGIEDLGEVGFDNIAERVTVETGTWRFYDEPGFEGESIDIEGQTGGNILGDLTGRVSSVRRVS